MKGTIKSEVVPLGCCSRGGQSHCQSILSDSSKPIYCDSEDKYHSLYLTSELSGQVK